MKRLLSTLSILVVGLALGLLSARYMMENATVGAAVGDGKWVEINIAGDSLNSTYLSGHFLLRGQVPPPRGVRYFVRTLDDDGNSLRGDCVTLLEGPPPLSRWWFVSADNGSARKSLDAGQAVLEADGQLNISISTNAVPGNWLQPPETGAYQLQLVLQGAATELNGAVPALPHVKRLWC